LRVPLRDQGGFTLAEVMVVVTIMLVVMFAIYSVFDASVKLFSLGISRAEATGNARIALERMEREIRAAYPYDAGASPADNRLLATMDPTRVTFGNESGSEDRRIDPATEGISYYLSADGPPYTLQKTQGGGAAQAVVENVGTFEDGSPGLLFEYLRESNGVLAETAVEGEVEAVRITLAAEENGYRRQVSTVVALRNRA
jgi:prepilin-type N-terminal cleavage/methylation domain-containing protein